MRIAWLVGLAAVVGLASSAAVAQEFKALFIGNSYTHYSSPNLPETFKQLSESTSGTTVTTGMHAPGGYTLAGHASDAQAQRGPHSLLTGSNWDLVVLQDQSQIPGFPDSQPEKQQSQAGGVYLAGLAEQSNALTAFFVTWGRRDGDSTNSGLFPDFETMNDRLNTGYTAYADAAATADRVIALIPAGAAFAAIKESHPDLFPKLYAGDGSHPSQLGTYATGCAALGALTGRLPSESSWAPGNIDATEAEAVRNTIADLIRNTVWTYRSTPYGERPYYVFVSRLSELPTFSDTLTVGGTLYRPWLLIDNTVSPMTSLTLNDAVARLTTGGVLDVGSLDASSGFFLFEGGTLRVAEYKGTLAQSAGTLAIMGTATIDGDYLNVGGELEIDVSPDGVADRLDVTGTAQLEFTLKVNPADSGVEDGWVRTVIAIDGPMPAEPYDITLDAPDGYEWRTVDDGSSHRVELLYGEAPAAVEMDSTADAGVSLDVGIPPVTSPDAGTFLPELETRSTSDEGGCTSAPSSVPPFVTLVLLTCLGLSLRSRRRT